MEKGGGKSLELMQRRLLSGQPAAEGANQQPKPQQQPPPQQQQQQQQQQINQNPRPGKSAASLMATQAREQAAATHSTMPPQPVAPSRPKGKDFAAMAMSVGAAKSKGGPVQQQQQPSAGAPSQVPRQSPVAPSRPKGKDFSAMANRMGAPPQPPTQQQPAPVPAPPVQQGARTNHQQQAANAEMEERAKLRAQQMQDAARAAAGLPPLSRPTAPTQTTPPKTNVNPAAPRGVTIMPPVNQPPQQNAMSYPPQQNVLPHHQQQQQQLQMQRVPQPNVARPQQAPQQRNVPKPQAPKRTSSASRSIQPGTASARSSQSSVSTAGHGGGHARYGSKPRTAPPKVSAEPPAPEAKVTPTPQIHEGRLSFAGIRPPSGAHAAPLVGQRIQDLVKSVDQNFTIDSEAEEQVLQLADDFLDKVVSQSLRLANHRGSKALDVQDLQLVLSKHWGIVVPGLGLPNIRSSTPGKQTTPKAGGIAGSGSGAKRKASDSAGSGPKKKPNLPSIPAAST